MSSPAARHARRLHPEAERPGGPKQLAIDSGHWSAVDAPATGNARTITFHLLLFAAALLVPALVLAASALTIFIKTQQNALRAEAVRRTHVAAALVSRQIAHLEQATRVLAESPALDTADFDRFRDQIRVTTEALGCRVVLIDMAEPKILVDFTPSQAGSETTAPSLAPDVVRVAARNAMAASRVVLTSVSPDADAFVAVAAVVRNGALLYALGTAQSGHFLEHRLRRTLPHDGTTAWVLDRNGRVIATTDNGSKIRAPAWPQVVLAGQHVAVRTENVSISERTGVLHLPGEDWTAVIRLGSAFATPVQSALVLFATTGLALIGLGASAAVVFGHRITHSVRSLAAHKLELAHDRTWSPPLTPIAEVNEVGVDLAMAAQVRRELERELVHSQTMEAIGRLTEGIAHDFSNLLTIILGNLEMLENLCDANDDRTQRELVAEAQASASLAASISEQLLAFARQQPLAPMVTDIGQLIRAIAHLLDRTLGQAIKLTVDVGDGLRARIDVPQFETAVLNLTVNARDAMPHGGELTIRATHAEITDEHTAARRLPPGRYVAMTVTDTGIGMSKETCERAFEPFFTTKSADVGTGLGLSLVYGFAKQSGGDAWIRSDIGKGTTVEVWMRTDEST